MFGEVSLQYHDLVSVTVFEAAVIALKEITSSYHIAGTIDYLLLVELKDMEAYQEFLKTKLTKIPHVAQINSNFVMTVLK